MCDSARNPYNLPAFKGILVQAVDDWSRATGSRAFRSFLVAQAMAVIRNDISDGRDSRAACATPHTCQLGFYWTRPVVPGASRIGVTVATQASAIDALTAVLPARRTPASHAGRR